MTKTCLDLVDPEASGRSEPGNEHSRWEAAGC